MSPVRSFGSVAAAESREVLERAAPALRDASIFITGGTGFFGRWLVASLLRANAQAGLGATLTLLTRDARRFAHDEPQLAGDRAVTLLEGDVRSFDMPRRSFTHVVHAATDTSSQAHARSAELVDTIVNGTLRTLEGAAAHGARRFLMVSSGAVYGRLPPEPVTEEFAGVPDPTQPASAYGLAKRAAEQSALAFASRGIDAVIARAFAFVGPGLPLDAHFAIGNFIADAVAGREIVVRGDGTATRSYLYAADLAAWLLTLLALGSAGRAYNVGSDRAVSIAELAALVSANVRGARGFRVEGAPGGGDRQRYVPSVARARAELGLEVWTPLDEAIRRTALYAAGLAGG